MQDTKTKKPKLLLHICCAGCGAYVSSVLKEEFEVILYYYNPNIFPESEYDVRLSEVKRIAEVSGLELVIGSYDHAKWLEKTLGKEKEPERGGRCLVCYRDRLTSTAILASERSIGLFASTLSVSPHKDFVVISLIGRELEKKYQISFLDRDFKKQDGFKKSLIMSRDLNLYRQNYCGCEFSRR